MACRYSPVGPIQILERLQGAEALGNYLLVIAHDVLVDDMGYSLLLDSLPYREDAPTFVIVDNGVIEHGIALSVRDVIDAADRAQADCIVMPDVIGDLKRTMALVFDGLPRLQDSGYPVMKVPQGKDISEVVRCIDWLADVAFPSSEDFWGIPRWMANKFGTRAPIIEYINTCRPNPKIHLLGMSHSWTDDVHCARMRNVIGIDSANPVVRGLLGQQMKIDSPEHLERGDYWASTEINGIVLDNIQYVREAIT